MSQKPFIELPVVTGTEFINPEDILAIKANDKHIQLIFENQPEKQIRLSMGSAEKKLNFPYLVRCHRSYIVNVLNPENLSIFFRLSNTNQFGNFQ